MAHRRPPAQNAALVTLALALLLGAIAWYVRPAVRSAAPATPTASRISHDVEQVAATATPHPTVIKKPQPRPVLHQSATATPTVKRVAAPAAKQYLALFVLDGARPDYFNVPGIPHLRALMKQGTQYSNAWAGILESETPTGHATISSGSNPLGSGILSFAWAGADNTTINLFDPANIRNGQMERILAAAPAPSIAKLVHQQDPSAKVVALGGHKYYANDALGGPDANVIMYYSGTPQGTFAPTYVPGHAPPVGLLREPGLTAPKTSLPLGVEDHLAMNLAMDTFQRMHERVMLMNVPEFDWPLGHVDGGSRDPQGVRILMQRFDQDLGKLEDMYRKAGILNETTFVITADHGMSPIYYKVDDKPITQAVEASGTKIISDTFHTAGYMWLQDSSKATQAAENVARLQNPYIQSVYFKAATSAATWVYLRATGGDLFHTPATEAANQYLLNTFDGVNGPDVVVFFTEEAGSLPGGEANWKGDHGGASWQAQHVPLIISGPGVRPGFTSQFPARLQDVAPTVLSLLGASHKGMQGMVLADALKHASTADLATQRANAAQLTTVTQTLAQESLAEVQALR